MDKVNWEPPMRLPPQPKAIQPSKTLLQGKQYTPAANTDIRKLFEKVRRQRVVDAMPDPFGDRA